MENHLEAGAPTLMQIVPEVCSGTHLRETLLRVEAVARNAKGSFARAGSQMGVWVPGMFPDNSQRVIGSAKVS
jgi:hypothetical protein